MPQVQIWCQLSHERIPYEENRTIDVLSLTNEVQQSKIDTFPLKSPKWKRWPEHRKYDGPGMAAELSRRLNIGDMYYRTTEIEDKFLFEVGVNINGIDKYEDL